MANRLYARSLLHMSLPSADGGDEDHIDEHDHSDGDTKALRIVAIFVILIAGMIGGYPPLFLKAFRDPNSGATRLVRSFSAGVIAALALVHIVPEAIVDMAGLGAIEYPVGGTCVLFGIAIMVLFEHLAHIAYLRGGSSSSCHHRHHTKSDRTQPLVDSAVLPSVAAADDGPCKPPPSPLPAPDKEQAGVDSVTGHTHVCVSRGSATNWVAAAAVEEVGSIRMKVVAWMFEAGCVFHSVIIGIGLGVNTTGVVEVRSLLIALVFHQWLEGLSLGGVIALGGFSLRKGATMILTYSLTCPVGIAIGMGIANTYDPESERARGVQGAFNGVSGGMLLYIALVQLIAEDMSRVAAPGKPDSVRSRLGCFAALCLGAGSMCLLAMWA